MVVIVPLSLVLYLHVVDVVRNLGANLLLTAVLYLIPYLFVFGARMSIMRGIFRKAI